MEGRKKLGSVIRFNTGNAMIERCVQNGVLLGSGVLIRESTSRYLTQYVQVFFAPKAMRKNSFIMKIPVWICASNSR